jgi:hypothetical protein
MIPTCYQKYYLISCLLGLFELKPYFEAISLEMQMKWNAECKLVRKKFLFFLKVLFFLSVHDTKYFSK